MEGKLMSSKHNSGRRFGRELPLAGAVRLQLRAAAPVDNRLKGSSGQTTAEYALVLLGVAALALLVLAWTTNTGKVGDLFDRVFDSIISNVT